MQKFWIVHLALLLVLIAACAPTDMSDRAPQKKTSPTPEPVTLPEHTFEAETVLTQGNESSGGGDWFVQPLPILKKKLSQSQEDVGGVIYKKILVPGCVDQTRVFPLSSSRSIVYFPGQNWEAFEVQIQYGRILCSYGMAEADPDRALPLLAGIKQGDVYSLDGKRSLYSRSTWGPLTMGPFLFLNRADHYRLFSLQATNYELKHLNRFYTAEPATTSGFEIYVPSEVKVSDRAYFGFMTQESMWSLVLPIAMSIQDFPLAELSLVASEPNARLLFFPVPKPGGYATERAVASIVWSNFHLTPTQLGLRKKAGQLAGIDLNPQHPGYFDIQYLPKNFLRFLFVPAIGEVDLQKANYHGMTNRHEIIIPIENPLWHVTGDVVHELTHVTQSSTSKMPSTEQTFLHEMEANINVQNHFEELAKIHPVVKIARPLFNATIAAMMPNLVWSKSEVKPKMQSLCTKVIAAYSLKKNAISVPVLKKYDCQK